MRRPLLACALLGAAVTTGFAEPRSSEAAQPRVTAHGSEACFERHGAQVTPMPFRDMLPKPLRPHVPTAIRDRGSYLVTLKNPGRVAAPTITVQGSSGARSVTIPGTAATTKVTGWVVFSGSPAARATSVAAYLQWIGRVYRIPKSHRTLRDAGIENHGALWADWSEPRPVGKNRDIVNLCLGPTTS